MGGDFGPRSIVQASLACLSATPSLHLTLVGQPSLLEELIHGQSAADRARLTIVAASEVITMDEKPAQALRGKPDSSMRVALELLRDGKVQAEPGTGRFLPRGPYAMIKPRGITIYSQLTLTNEQAGLDIKHIAFHDTSGDPDTNTRMLEDRLKEARFVKGQAAPLYG